MAFKFFFQDSVWNHFKSNSRRVKNNNILLLTLTTKSSHITSTPFVNLWTILKLCYMQTAIVVGVYLADHIFWCYGSLKDFQSKVSIFFTSVQLFRIWHSKQKVKPCKVAMNSTKYVHVLHMHPDTAGKYIHDTIGHLVYYSRSHESGLFTRAVKCTPFWVSKGKWYTNKITEKEDLWVG